MKKRDIISKFYDRLPKFPDGRIDYTGCNEAPVVNVFVEHNGKILLLQRSDKVSNYNGKWNSISGFIDTLTPPREIALKEAKEEIGIEDRDVKEIVEADILEIKDSEIAKTWFVFPFLIKLNREPDIKLDWEHSAFVWINPKEISHYDVVFDLDLVLATFHLD